MSNIVPCACGFWSSRIEHVCLKPLTRTVSPCPPPCGFHDKDMPHVCAVPDPVVYLAEERAKRAREAVTVTPPPTNRPAHMCAECPSETQLCRPCFYKLGIGGKDMYEKLYGGHVRAESGE